MPIRPLADIGVDHAFFASGTFAGAQIRPDAATAARLRGLRLVAKPRGGGLTIYVETDAQGKAKIAVPPATLLRFDLLQLPRGLAEATDVTAILPGAVFSDAGIAGNPVTLALTVREARASEVLTKPAGSATLVLAGRPKAGTAAAFTVVPPANGAKVTAFDATGNRVTLSGAAATVVTLDYPVAVARPAGTLAAIEITIGPDTVTQAVAGTPRRCVVALQPNAARWCFHLVTDMANPLADWRITRANGANGGPPVTFSAAGRAEIAAPAADDAMGSALLLRSAPLRVLRFVSDAPVPCSETVTRGVGLFAGAAQLFAALPNPSPANSGRVGGQATFGEVIRLVTA